MSKKQLKIIGTEIRRTEPGPKSKVEAESSVPVQELMRLSVEVENPTDKPLHVWASRRAYHYDASTRTLTVYLTENTPAPPPDIKMISNHPRTPKQVVVEPGGRATVDVPVPSMIRRPIPGEGLGMRFVEEPIGQIDQVDLHIQYAGGPPPDLKKENPAEHREQLKAHGNVVRATITPTGRKEQ